jgi:hypothetical protein
MNQNNVSKAEIQGIFACGANSYLERFPANKQQRKAIYSIVNCRGPRLGKHIDKCDQCGHLEISYNSCRNRHCPKCQQSKQLEWVSQLKASLPPVRYFHLVFTLPHELNELVYKHQRDIYPLLFKASAQTILQVASKPGFLGARTGCLSILHTWGQNLQYHPHIHMLVPAGGLSEDNMEWIHSGKKFFSPVKVLSRVFRGKFCSMLEGLMANGKIQTDLPTLKAELYKRDWVVYVKKPFAGPTQIINYLGRYTHRIAISNSRILSHQNDKVSFRWKDYRNKAYWKTMQLDTLEFMRRFLLHVLPCNFYKIRYYGILALAYRSQILMQCQASIQLQEYKSSIPEIYCEAAPEFLSRKCPNCRVGTLRFLKLLMPGAG